MRAKFPAAIWVLARSSSQRAMSAPGHFGIRPAGGGAPRGLSKQWTVLLAGDCRWQVREVAEHRYRLRPEPEVGCRLELPATTRRWCRGWRVRASRLREGLRSIREVAHWKGKRARMRQRRLRIGSRERRVGLRSGRAGGGGLAQELRRAAERRRCRRHGRRGSRRSICKCASKVAQIGFDHER